MKKIKLPWLAIALVAVLAVGIGAGYLGNNLIHDGKTTQLTFEDIGELATQAAYCTEVNVTQAERELFGLSIPFTQSKYIYSYDVILKAGYDFSQITYEVDEESQTIEVRLPQVQILSSELDLDSFQVYEEDESIFRPIRLEETNAAMQQMQQRAEGGTPSQTGLLDNARANAELVLTGFFRRRVRFGRVQPSPLSMPKREGRR